MSGGEERTEKATPKRMKELRRDGALQKSQDLSAWLGLGVAAVMMPMVIGTASRAGQQQLETVRDVIAHPDAGAATAALSGGLGSMLGTLAPLFGTVVLTAVAATAVQGGIHVSGKALKPKLDQLNVAKGIKRVFSMQSLWQGGKAALKTAAIGMVLYSVVQGLVPMLLGSGMHSLSVILQAAGAGVSGLTRTAVIAGLVLAAFDVVVIMRRNRKKTRMTKKEIRDEMRQSEGDPLVKGQIRSRQLAMSRNRMIASVADADVVLVNPTHVAVALRYEPGKGAPRVIAKGKGHVAARIRAKAAELRVPMIEDVPLARALHSACEVGQEIPAHLYIAVAKVLAFVMALRRRGAATGVHRAPTGPTRVEEMVAA